MGCTSASVLARAAMAAKARGRRAAAQQEGRQRAQSLGYRYAAGCMLFWAEGSRQRNKVVFTNSDPDMARFFVGFMREFFEISSERFRLTCNLFTDHEARQREIEDFWLSTAQLPRGCLCKSTVNRYSRYSQKKRKNKLP